ncbi:hypothetical protein V490_00233 [Pseudogymnoascus sp. VKM F-3557]|nr:hypothetical protein V490_00233 [Pseudogymnoascus sp. VKM F-3557]
MTDIAPNRTNAITAAQAGKGGGTIQSNGLATPEPTPGPEAERIAADQLRQSIEVSELEKVLGIKVDRRLDQVEEIKNIYLEKAPIAAKNESDWSACVATGISKEWIDETNEQLKLIPDQTSPSHTSTLPGGAQYEKAMSLEEIEQILGIKNIPGVDQLEEIKQTYVAKAPQVARDKEAWQKLQAAVEASGITRGWIEAANYELKLIQDEKEDEEMEDEEATAFIQEVYTRVTPTMEKILSGDDDDKLHMEILEANNAIASWQQTHPVKEDMVDLIDIKRIEDIVVKAHFQAVKFEKDPANARAKEQFLNRVQELAELVEASSYPSTWILKPLYEAPKPPPSGGNNTGPAGTAPTGTAPTGTAPASVAAGGITDNGTGKTDVGKDPYELNKLNAGKPGFTEDGEMIMGHKYKYFRKGDKKGQVYSGQVFVAIGPQACPHVKVLPLKDFTSNTVDAYLNCAHAMEAGGRTEKDEFVKIVCTAAESCGPEPLREPAIYALCERKEGNPIWVWRTDLQDWVESKRAADNLLRKCMEREKNERAQFYAAHGIKEEPESRDRVEDKRARVYGKKANAPSTEDRIFPFVGASVSRAMKAEAQPTIKVEGQPAITVEAQGGFDPTSFLSFTAWYEKRHNLKLGADPAELTKLMAAFKTIQDALSL